MINHTNMINHMYMINQVNQTQTQMLHHMNGCLLLGSILIAFCLKKKPCEHRADPLWSSIGTHFVRQ